MFAAVLIDRPLDRWAAGFPAPLPRGFCLLFSRLIAIVRFHASGALMKLHAPGPRGILGNASASQKDATDVILGLEVLIPVDYGIVGKDWVVELVGTDE